MKLNLLKPNAVYDIVHGKPSIFEQDNDGSYLYRYNIEPEIGIPDVPDGQTNEIQIGWHCREIRIWRKPTKAVLKKAIIRSILDESEEFKIVNAYNKHILGVKLDESAVDNYKEYLQLTEDLDAMLMSDISNIHNE